ncbi:hypothetical protein EBZ39_05835 [bacterium]|nr:hypothetical protein [bacterium]
MIIEPLEATWRPHLLACQHARSFRHFREYCVEIGWDGRADQRRYRIEVFSLEALTSMDAFDVYRLEKSLIVRDYEEACVQESIAQLLGECQRALSWEGAKDCVDKLLTHDQTIQSRAERRDMYQFFLRRDIVQQSLVDGRLYPENLDYCRETVRFIGRSADGQEGSMDIEFITVPWLEEYFKTHDILYLQYARIMHFFDYDYLLPEQRVPFAK